MPLMSLKIRLLMTTTSINCHQNFPGATCNLIKRVLYEKKFLSSCYSLLISNQDCCQTIYFPSYRGSKVNQNLTYLCRSKHHCHDGKIVLETMGLSAWTKPGKF